MHALAHDWRKARLGAVDAALCAFAEKLTRIPQAMGQADVDTLRAVGLDDRAIHDAAQVVSYFNYINRIADGLGVEREAFIPPWGESPSPEEPPRSESPLTQADDHPPAPADP